MKIPDRHHHPGGWLARAACVNEDPELFFPVPVDGRSTLAAKRVCHGCPVREECLTYAMDVGLRHGIWGGLTELERRAMRRVEIEDRITVGAEEMMHR